VSLSGCATLDIGSGMGGADIVLVKNHGAASVVGVDVQNELVTAARARAISNGLGDRITYQLITAGSLPFSSHQFDAVFSKDAIIHVHDKKALYGEMFRVLKPGGRLLVSDWLRGHERHHDDQVQKFIEASGHDFALTSLEDLSDMAKSIGFTDVEIEDRQSWYVKESRRELEQLHGPLGQQFRKKWGNKATEDEIAFWEVLVSSVVKGAIRPGHIRANRPR
jgi:ubiquinone/menaquinone biosynthesis C-methylase UbiE